MEIKHPPEQKLLRSLDDKTHIMQESVRLSPDQQGVYSNGDSRGASAIQRLALESEHEQLIKLRDRNFMYAHIALFAGLACAISGVVLVATQTKDLQAGLSIGATSATASGVMLYLRATFMKTVDKTLDHIQKMRETANRRAYQDSLWETTQLAIERGSPGYTTVVKILFSNQSNEA
ncbi:hypothetical protein [Microbispora sp. H10885]|uniref:hypothetical protein n=1 Tax=Microbispora sp. H10885 TaxID=2729110 RepID=UPI00160372CA|nr:hypothetical protein [Microbispora sp. H10885]